MIILFTSSKVTYNKNEEIDKFINKSRLQTAETLMLKHSLHVNNSGVLRPLLTAWRAIGYFKNGPSIFYSTMYCKFILA